MSFTKRFGTVIEQRFEIRITQAERTIRSIEEVGSNANIVKSSFDQSSLLEIVTRFV